MNIPIYQFKIIMDFSKTFFQEINSQQYKLVVEADRLGLYLSLWCSSGILPITYEKTYNKQEISSNIPFFESFCSNTDIAYCICSLLETKKGKVDIPDNLSKATLILYPPSEINQEIKLTLDLKDIDKNKLIENLYSNMIQMSSQISILSDKVKKIENEQITQKQFQETNKKIEKLNIKINKINTVSINPNEDNLYLKRIQAVLSNNILIDSKGEKELIKKWINPNDNCTINMSLLYKASIDSDSAAAFHEKCDNHSPTLTLVKTDQGIRFGGFTTLTWNTDENCKIDKNSFIFSIDYKKKYELNENALCSIYCHPNYGPCFGSGFDLCLPNGFIQSNGTYSKFPSSYGAGASKNELTMKNINFSVIEVEVYQIDISLD